MVSALLDETLAAIASERGGGFNRSFSLASDLLAEYGEPRLAERLITDIPPTVPWEVVADLLGILSWTTSDNGSASFRTAERWLREATDLRRILIALNLDVYPFLDSKEMERVLLRVADRHPEASGRCRELIAARRREGGGS
ncbi:hypothetical protein [Aquisphaera insulae]|uniref:hypothetical protein n=1 Tax=Aquisphaera insulae TaxID=2712864 RepID=UPI0013ECD176|nr:hypothetical protein [Aquisphaera insulae]